MDKDIRNNIAQRLCSQANMIKENEWITKPELENIKRGYFKMKK